jgi:hypothetical protein
VALAERAAAATDWLRSYASRLRRRHAVWVQRHADRLRPHARWVRRHADRLIEAVDPGPGPDIPRVPLDTLLDDADSSGVAAGPDRTAGVGPGAPQRGPR